MRAGSWRSNGADEGDGYLLMLAYDQTTELSEMMVFESTSVEKGPIAKVKLPVRIPAADRDKEVLVPASMLVSRRLTGDGVG